MVFHCKNLVDSTIWFIIFQTKVLMGEVMREAAFSLAEAKFTAGDFRYDLNGEFFKGQRVLTFIILKSFKNQTCKY